MELYNCDTIDKLEEELNYFYESIRKKINHYQGDQVFHDMQKVLHSYEIDLQIIKLHKKIKGEISCGN